jgi:integrase
MTEVEHRITFGDCIKILEEIKSEGHITEYRQGMVMLFASLNPKEVGALKRSDIRMDGNRMVVESRTKNRLQPLYPILKRVFEDMFEENEYERQDKIFPIRNPKKWTMVLKPYENFIPHSKMIPSVTLSTFYRVHRETMKEMQE